jgi:hypothetical protein
MAVLQTVSNGRCKICQHPERRRIETLLEHRHHRRRDASGERITAAYVIRKMGEWGMPNPNLDNINLHQSKHMKFVEDTKKLHALDSGRKTHVELKNGTRPHVDIDENLRWMISVGRQEIEDRIIRGEKSGITTDHVLKATDALTRRQHNDAQHELLGALVGGIGDAIGAVPAKPLNPVPPAIVLELEATEDAEFVEIAAKEIRLEQPQQAEPEPQEVPAWVEDAKAKQAART